jgi:DNA-binding GntR family transcriptional regulator
VIKFERYRGFRLQLPGPGDLAQIFAVRVALEIPAARKTASRNRVCTRCRSAELTAAPIDRTIRST